jgi:hypothetical protein
MSRLQSNCLIAVIIAILLAGSLVMFAGDDPDQPSVSRVHDEQPCPPPITAATTLGDFSIIPQTIAPFAAAFNSSLSAGEQHQLTLQFHQHYFSPWTATSPLFNGDTVHQGIQWLATSTWYDETRLQVEPPRMHHLLALADMDHFPSRDQRGIVIRPTFVRVLPTTRPFFETADDYPFDHLQFSEIKPNEPVRILHTSTDGAWLYIETSYANGWVEPNAIRLVDDSLRNHLVQAEHLVIVRDFVRVQAEQVVNLPQPKIGTLYPLVREEPDHWLVSVAIAGDDQHAALTTARIAKGDARRHPLPFTPETVALIGDELLKTPYGWGEMYRNRDCSATTRDFFLAFGIWLPRNSQKQISSGPLISLANLSSADKEARIRDQAIPFRTLLHHKGHIMLYVGLHEGKPIILHTIWALRHKPQDCPEQKLMLGKTLLSTLVLGEELSLSKGTTIKRLDSMLSLPILDQPCIVSNPTSPDEKK